jgi:hypothetical protein
MSSSQPQPLAPSVASSTLDKQVMGLQKQAAREALQTNRRCAGDPECPPEVLARLAYSKDNATRRSVAGNPQTPREILMLLAVRYPVEFFLNPAFDFLLLEDPDLFGRMPVSVFKRIAQHPDCPRSFLEWAVVHGDSGLLKAVAGREKTPRDLLRRISDGRHVRAAELAASRLMSMED